MAKLKELFGVNAPQISKVKDLIPHPLNPKLNPFEKNAEERKDLGKRFAEHAANDPNGIPNHNPILICPKTNTIWSGHNRYYTAIENEYDEVHTAYASKEYDADEPVESQMTYIEQMNADGKRDESKPSTILNKWHTMADAYVGDDDKYKWTPRGKFTEFFKDFAWSRKMPPATFRKLLMIEEYNPQWILDLESGKFKSIDKVYKMTREEEPENKENPNRHDFFKTFDENPKILKDTLDMTVAWIRHNKSFSYGGELVLLDDFVGWETNGLSTMLSHTVMTSMATAFRNSGIPLLEDCMTAGGMNKKQDWADIRFPELDVDGCQTEQIEVKAASAGATCASTLIRGGQGLNKIHPHEFTIPIWDNNLNRMFIMVATLTKEDWIGEGDNKVMSLKAWHKNHFHKGDYRFIIGEIYEDTKGEPKIDFGKIDTCVAFNKDK